MSNIHDVFIRFSLCHLCLCESHLCIDVRFVCVSCICDMCAQDQLKQTYSFRHWKKKIRRRVYWTSKIGNIQITFHDSLMHNHFIKSSENQEHRFQATRFWCFTRLHARFAHLKAYLCRCRPRKGWISVSMYQNDGTAWENLDTCV